MTIVIAIVRNRVGYFNYVVIILLSRISQRFNACKIVRNTDLLVSFTQHHFSSNLSIDPLLIHAGIHTHFHDELTEMADAFIVASKTLL